jgi:hypothetical protein
MVPSLAASVPVLGRYQTSTSPVRYLVSSRTDYPSGADLWSDFCWVRRSDLRALRRRLAFAEEAREVVVAGSEEGWEVGSEMEVTIRSVGPRWSAMVRKARRLKRHGRRNRCLPCIYLYSPRDLLSLLPHWDRQIENDM